MAPRPCSPLLQFRLAVSLLALLLAPSTGLLPTLPDSDVVDENNLVEGAPQPLSLPDVVRLIQRLQQEDEFPGVGEKGGPIDEQDSRIVGITNGGIYRGDLVVYLPITILLPTFAFRSRYSLAGRKNSDWLSFLFGRNKFRSYDGNQKEMDIRGPVDQVLTNQIRYDPDLPEYQSDKDYGPLLSRLDAYFHYLRVNDDDCRMVAICQMAQDPTTYTPLSHLVLSALKKSESLSRPSSYNAAVFRFFRYYWAAERGASGENCSQTYPRCPATLPDIVNVRVLKFWQNLANLVSIKLSDE